MQATTPGRPSAGGRYLAFGVSYTAGGYLDEQTERIELGRQAPVRRDGCTPRR